MTDDSELVYSTDPARNKRCSRCKKLIPECECSLERKSPLSSFTPVLRIEKSGRKGKVVTVLDRLPRSELFLKEFSRMLKTRCGAGGTYHASSEYGRVEVQGDKRERIRKILTDDGITFKG